MRVLVLGGTGGIGPLLIQALLAANHSLVVYARSPNKLSEDITSNPLVDVVKGDLTDRDALFSALQHGGQSVNAVVSCLGPPVNVTSGFTYPSDTPLAKAYTLLFELMHIANVKRIIALGTASNKDEHDKFDLQFATLVLGVATFAHGAYKDIVAIGKALREQPIGELVWTLVRVPLLTTSKKSDFVAGYVGDKKTKTHLARNAFAAFVVAELNGNEWANKAPLLSDA
ncbi:NAD-P-binding protein [Schizopora paradoxa]|uniref:NAD-P-binding protein n=1 Tax=Schizopora paradoxa TaxID=27342 RepID=A0A0H2RSP0_9AGAM|nr:NAD-P-binding protein [Schizopora paradoxa]